MNILFLLSDQCQVKSISRVTLQRSKKVVFLVKKIGKNLKLNYNIFFRQLRRIAPVNKQAVKSAVAQH